MYSTTYIFLFRKSKGFYEDKVRSLELRSHIFVSFGIYSLSLDSDINFGFPGWFHLEWRSLVKNMEPCNLLSLLMLCHLSVTNVITFQVICVPFCENSNDKRNKNISVRDYKKYEHLVLKNEE